MASFFYGYFSSLLMENPERRYIMGYIYKDESLSDEEKFVLAWEKLEKDNKELFEICIDFSDPNKDLEELRQKDGG